MDINQVYDIVKFISNKHEQGYLSPEEFNNSINLAQKQLMSHIIESIQGWDDNRRRIRIPMGNAQPNIQKISRFIESNVVTVPINGQLPRPVNLEHMLAVRTQSNLKRVTRCEHDRIFSYRSSVIDIPYENPIYVEYNSYYQIYPENIGEVSFEYVVTPPDALWAYTTVGGRPQYDQGNSVQLLWGETEITEIISRVLFMFGISIQAQNVVSYSQSIKNDGQ